MKQLLIFGLGYTGKAIARAALTQGWRITATGRDGTLRFDDAPAVLAAIGGADAILSSVPPAQGLDPVLEAYGDALKGKRLAYLSSTGVYGDCGGAWVDESAPVVGKGGTGRRAARAQADAAWLDLGAQVFRLPGIYGPPIDGQGGRSAFDRLREGRAHRVDLPDQIFSRIHVEDIASAVLLALESGAPAGAYNLADNLPAPQNAVIEEACRLSGLPLPPLLSPQEVPPASRAFYAENRRVANGKARRMLGWAPRFGDYRSGLRAIWDEEAGV
ncbi:SDR family NAD(P)-dependent oxidoreductase [Novosphingobium umbonatum]|uniref:SDR family NAD(P)-dependent oxidoreductase n=1 Tax=Novosphingobium umbonatum TaxID=1908524 RepID=A0A3S2UR60_9SPHN|nr:SDR family NAD(P)-dependent oxidoreductase [Novosphingobium umbonatum]RVU04132.1 SDR family NAD(P)-dependent oxidoreductase [Novosphingobium umbonatum]